MPALLADLLSRVGYDDIETRRESRSSRLRMPESRPTSRFRQWKDRYRLDGQGAGQSHGPVLFLIRLMRK
jgi:hypothetical protein